MGMDIKVEKDKKLNVRCKFPYKIWELEEKEYRVT